MLSVGEIEAGLGRQRRVNTALDAMIDRINSGQALNTPDCPAKALPVLSEVSAPVFSRSPPVSAGPGHVSGSSFAKISQRPFGNQTGSLVQRSVSSSSLPRGNGFPPVRGGADQRQAGGAFVEKKNSGAVRPSPISIPFANMVSRFFSSLISERSSAFSRSWPDFPLKSI